ncbi:MAG: hypothetical protein C00003105_00085 [ANME-2 cluster archaeon HR1]|nr:MAG: hypothetical protein C5S41_04925 [ANME-2 cluster archaeon]KAF5427123.1 hypothetical protein C5S42_05780 [ANME-2 cluster archaeon]PPA79892.1 MAG: hypothetical protein C00003105_00085 [ANME-2 cluster archaeon HR1]
MSIHQKLSYIAEVEFFDIVDVVEFSEDKLRIHFIDRSFIDIWFSKKIKGRYAYHWERGGVDGKIYRHDNIPHKRWNYVKTFPKHFHNGSENIVNESSISDEPENAIREFLVFARKIISK